MVVYIPDKVSQTAFSTKARICQSCLENDDYPYLVELEHYINPGRQTILDRPQLMQVGLLHEPNIRLLRDTNTYIYMAVARLWRGCGSKNRYQNGTLVSGNMDQTLRNPSCLILSNIHTYIYIYTHIVPKHIWPSPWVARFNICSTPQRNDSSDCSKDSRFFRPTLPANIILLAPTRFGQKTPLNNLLTPPRFKTSLSGPTSKIQKKCYENCHKAIHHALANTRSFHSRKGCHCRNQENG